TELRQPLVAQAFRDTDEPAVAAELAGELEEERERVLLLRSRIQAREHLGIELIARPPEAQWQRPRHDSVAASELGRPHEDIDHLACQNCAGLDAAQRSAERCELPLETFVAIRSDGTARRIRCGEL